MENNNSITAKLHEKIFRMKKKTLNTLTITIDVLMFIVFILTLILRTNLMFGLFWIFIILYFIVDMMNVMHWDYDGLKADQNKASKVIGSFRDITTVTIVFSGFFYLIVIFLDNIKVISMANIYVVAIMYILLSVAQLFNHLSIRNGLKENKKLAKKYSK
ncbi:MAG: hypothetical protein IJE89_04515 [Bacilli bacterium]|nr:hypothetical protein [Bacilli bacterium]